MEAGAAQKHLGDALFLDVRESYEFDAGHIEGSIHIPLMQLPERFAELPKDRTVIAVCQIGQRSELAAHFLTEQGFDAHNLEAGIAKFYERVEPLTTTPKMGPVLWQLPENFHRDDDRLAEALAALPPGRHTFEFRHASWFKEPVYELLREHGAALAIGDHPERPFQSHEMTADWTFVRFHYGHRGRRGNYAESELETWAKRLERWREDVEILVYFNNDWEEFAPRNAVVLRRKLAP